MRRRDRVRRTLREAGDDLLALCELVGYLVLVSAVSFFVQHAPWPDALIGAVFILIMVVRRFRRWMNRVD